MKTIEMKVDIAGVLLEVARTAGYVAAKDGVVVGRAGADASDGGDLYDKINVVDEDGVLLRRFFGECRTDLLGIFASRVVAEGDDEEMGEYRLALSVYDGFNEALLPALGLKLKQYFVAGVTAKWFMYTKREDVEAYASEADAVLGGLAGMTVQRVFTRKGYL